MITRTCVAVAMASAFGFSNGASAQVVDSVVDTYFGISAGARFSSTEYNEFGGFEVTDGEIDGDTNAAGAIHFGAEFPLGFGASIDLGYSDASIEGVIQTTSGPVSITTDTGMLTTFLNGQYRIPGVPILTPYVEVGVGYGYLTNDVETPGAFGVRGGGGVSTPVSPKVSLFVEGGYQKFFGFEQTYVNGFGATATGEFDIEAIDVSAGLNYKF